jgi:hypothetical protein
MQFAWKGLWVLVFAGGLAACGGGGGGGGDNGGEEPVPEVYPTLVRGPGFDLPSLAPPPERTRVAGRLRGEVRVGGGTLAPAGLAVELLDATDPAAPRVAASARTDAGGGFDLADALAGRPAVARWLRVRLSDGTLLRAFAGGWTEITPGTEIALAEIVRLRAAGAFDGRSLAGADLAATQAALSLWWHGRSAQPLDALGLTALRREVAVLAPWNAQLANLASAEPKPGTGDFAGLMPVEDASWPSDVTGTEAPSSSTVTANCLQRPPAERRDCVIRASDLPDDYDQVTVLRTGLALRPHDDPDPLSIALATAGELALLEHAPEVGTKVLFRDATIDLPTAPALRASVKVTRHTYPVAPFRALGGTVPAVEVVHDYEIAVLDPGSGTQLDVLVRERRWFSPGRGRVGYAAEGIARGAGTTVNRTLRIVARSVTGAFSTEAAWPLAGAADVVARGLRHRDAVYAAARDRIYAATAANGGTLLELDPATLATLRTLQLPAAPRKLGVSADGTRLYVGLDSGRVSELVLPGFTIVRSFDLPLDPYGAPYDRVYGLAVDPFDAARVLVQAGAGTGLGGSTVVLAYRDGVLVARDAPRTYAFDYGWGYYSLSELAWSGTRDTFIGAFLGSPYSVWRFGIGPSGFSELAASERVDEAGVVDVDGIVVADAGALLDAATLAPLRSLALAPFQLARCQVFDAVSALCRFRGDASWLPSWARLGLADGAFLGTFQPRLAAPVPSGCPEVGRDEGSFGVDDVRLQPMGGGRSLGRSIDIGEGERCGLQVWRFRLAD